LRPDGARFGAGRSQAEEFGGILAREIGFSAVLEVPNDRETEEEYIDCETGSWGVFLSELRNDPAWQAVADLPCTKRTVVDDEID
jgi:hypothetical protein